MQGHHHGCKSDGDRTGPDSHEYHGRTAYDAGVSQGMFIGTILFCTAKLFTEFYAMFIWRITLQNRNVGLVNEL